MGKIVVKYEVLLNLSKIINSLENEINNDTRRVTSAAVYSNFNGMQRMQCPKINHLEQELYNLTSSRNRIVDKLSRLRRYLQDAVNKFQEADNKVNFDIGSRTTIAGSAKSASDKLKEKFGQILTKDEAEKYIKGDLLGTYNSKQISKLPQRITYKDDKSGYTYTYELGVLSATFFGVKMNAKDNIIKLKNGEVEDLNSYSYKLISSDEPKVLAGTVMVDGLGEAGVAVDYVRLSEDLGKKIVEDGYKVNDIETAEQANLDWAKKGYINPPVAGNTKVYNVEAGDYHYVRTYNNDWDNYNGKWIMKTEDIEGLSAEEIAEKYAMPTPPNMICDVEMPNNTPLEISVVGEQPNWNASAGGGNTQYGIKDVETSESWYVNKKPLK